jgi:hypothetical protein
MNKFTADVFFISTVEDQNNYFTGNVQVKSNLEFGTSINLNPGTYRVIDGALFQVVPGLPPCFEQ